MENQILSKPDKVMYNVLGYILPLQLLGSYGLGKHFIENYDKMTSEEAILTGVGAFICAGASFMATQRKRLFGLENKIAKE